MAKTAVWAGYQVVVEQRRGMGGVRTGWGGIWVGQGWEKKIGCGGSREIIPYPQKLLTRNKTATFNRVGLVFCLQKCTNCFIPAKAD